MSPATPEEDDERTLMPGEVPGPPSESAQQAAANYSRNALPVGTRIGEFQISSLIGEGGFGIVYLVHDQSLQRNVALKEYMPSSFAGRMDGLTVAVRSERHAETFGVGLRSFINEARLLAQFDHPSLLKVYRFWEANGTGYFVMPYYDGSITLKEALVAEPGLATEQWLKRLLAQLLDALEVLHRAQCFHRDISPDNILLLKDGRPLLLDFGSARRVIGDMTQALTVFLKPGYAPMEQYAEEHSLKQGPWTDLYALAAVVYFAITGRPPIPSVARMMSDTLVPAATAGAGRYSSGFLHAIDLGLSVRPENRPQSAAEFRHLLGLDDPGQSAKFVADNPPADIVDMSARDSSTRPWMQRAAIAGVIGAVVIGGAIWWDVGGRKAETLPAPTSASTTTSPTLPAQTSASTATTPTLPAQSPPVIPPAANKPPPTPAPIPPVDKAPASSASTTPGAPSASPAEAPRAPPEKVYDPRRVLAEVYAARDRTHAVSVAVEKTQVNFNRGDSIGFSVSSSRPGFVYVLEVGIEGGGKSSLLLLFPNAVDRNNRIDSDTTMKLPRASWPLVAGGPAGIDRFLVIVSDSERDFRGLGMRMIGREGYGEFQRSTASQHYRTYTGATPLFAGKAKCPADGRACSNAYGAAEFTVEEVAR